MDAILPHIAKTGGWRDNGDTTEGDPSDESAVFALTSRRDGTKGTYTVAFGTLMDGMDADVVRHLGTADR